MESGGSARMSAQSKVVMLLCGIPVAVQKLVMLRNVVSCAGDSERSGLLLVSRGRVSQDGLSKRDSDGDTEPGLGLKTLKL